MPTAYSYDTIPNSRPETNRARTSSRCAFFSVRLDLLQLRKKPIKIRPKSNPTAVCTKKCGYTSEGDNAAFPQPGPLPCLLHTLLPPKNPLGCSGGSCCVLVRMILLIVILQLCWKSIRYDTDKQKTSLSIRTISICDKLKRSFSVSTKNNTAGMPGFGGENAFDVSRRYPTLLLIIVCTSPETVQSSSMSTQSKHHVSR